MSRATSRVDELVKKRQLLEAKKTVLEKELPHLHLYKFYPWAREFFDSTNKVTLLCAANQISKALDIETQIPTPNGFKKMGDIKIGDLVLGEDGLPTKVIDIPFEGEDESYEFLFDDNSKVISSKEHEWVCKTFKERFRKKYTNNFDRSNKKGKVFENKDYGNWIIKTTKDILKIGGLNPTPAQAISIPIAKPIDNKNPTPVFDPYLVGLLIGDGGLTGRSVVLTTKDQEIKDYAFSRGGVETGLYGIRINGIQPKMRELGLMGLGSLDKHIPECYFTASIEDRLSLLQGLLDSDGTINSKSAVSLTTISPQLRDDTIRLISSLGGKAKYTKRKAGYKKDGKYIECHPCYYIAIKILINPFRLERKASKFYKTRYKHERVLREIRSVGVRKVKCISVDNASHTFLCTKDYIVTHNSSTQIRRMIDWATEDKKWVELWGTHQTPNLFWYFYPSKEVATVEFEKKWSQFMPCGAMRDDKKYGWRAVYDKKNIDKINFNSGITIDFKTYNQSVHNLQSSTVFAVAADEELPEEYYDELMFRLAATDGYFSMAFTATMGQELWWRAMECIGKDSEFLPNAHKIQVSMYDCLKYEDGSVTPWNVDRIQKIKEKCKSKAEVLRRVYGRFVKEGGRTYHSFDPVEHYISPEDIDIEGWGKYAAVDIGSGGSDGHPAAIVFVAIKPDGSQGVVYKMWRGDGIQTTSGDIYQKYVELRGSDIITRKWYDWASADYNAITSRIGDPFEKANKSHDLGESLVNTLFSNNMLKVIDNEDGRKLGGELITLQKATLKNKCKDDLVDALRYCAVEMPWDMKKIAPKGTFKKVEKTYKMPQNQEEWNRYHDKMREVGRKPKKSNDSWQFSQEIDFWNGQY